MLMSTLQPNRILAVEIRAARLGYAVIESPKELRDFGAASFVSGTSARSRIARLLGLYSPSVLVLRGAGSRYPRDMQVRKAVARIVRSEARKAGVSTVRVSESEFKTFFEPHSFRDKYDIAAVIAGWFPELAWRVPPPVDFYDPEPRQMLYFDSIALGIAYLELAAKPGFQNINDDGILSPASK
jgi:hypothetical protein